MSAAHHFSGWQGAALFAGPPVLALAIGLFSSSPLSFGGWVDGLCYASLLLLMAWGILFVIQGNFFTAFRISCKRFFAPWRRQESFIRQVEGGQIESGQAQGGHSEASFQSRVMAHGLFFWVGAGYFALSFICSLFLLK
ncbi:DUF3899 domain-containing protein [Brevibacillus borstelensis]|uniref:DUF3899 domain-containing protein n=1 Tax=Brevibacillus borstelensis TaxID=45462 RepID=UPI0030BCA695